MTGKVLNFIRGPVIFVNLTTKYSIKNASSFRRGSKSRDVLGLNGGSSDQGILVALQIVYQPHVANDQTRDERTENKNRENAQTIFVDSQKTAQILMSIIWPSTSLCCISLFSIT